MAISLPQEVKNLTVNTVEFNGVASVPMLTYPRTGAGDSDGAGGDGYEDPNGYLVVRQADIFRYGGDPKNTDQGVTQVGDLQS